jgi:hypothetical protein
MSLLNKIFILVLILLTLNLYFPRIHFAQELKLYSESIIAKSPEIRSASAPEIRSTPEEKIPVEKVVKKKGKWLWWLLGLVIVGGGAAAVAGGGEDSKDSNQSDSGTATINW